MMDTLRRAAQGWTAKILIGLLVMSFAVWGVADVFTGFRGGTLASVGSEEISSDQFAQTFRRSLQNYSQQLGENITPERARELGIDRQVLTEMIRASAIVAQAKGLKLAIGNDQITADIAKNPNFVNSQGKFDPGRVKSFLQQSGQSEAGFLAAEREQLLRSAIADTVQGGLTMPDTLVGAVSRFTKEQRDARYFVAKAPAGQIAQPSEDEIKAFYDKNPGRYTAPEYRTLAILRAEPSEFAAAVKLTDEELKAGFEKYKSEYFTPERRTLLQTSFPSADEAKKAKQRISAGEDFLAIAKERGFSEQDTTWGDRGASDIPDPAIASAAFSLKEGEVSEPVEGQLAVFLIKAVKVSPEHQQSFEEAREALTKRLQLDKANEELRGIFDTVEDARAAQTPFEEISKSANIPFILVPGIDEAGKDKDGKAIELPQKAELLKLAFQTEAGAENDAFNTSENGYVWYEVRELVPSQVKPLDAVKEQVKSDLAAQKLRELALENAKKLVERAKTGTPLETLAKESGAEIKTVQGLKRNETSQDFDGAAVTALFSVPQAGVSFAPEADGQGAKIIQAQAVLETAFDAKSAESSALRAPLTQAAGGDLLGSYLVNLQNQLGFTVNDSLWRQITGAPQQ